MFRCDDDYAIRRTRTIYRGRGGIFKHLHCLDVGGVDAVDIVGGHAVDYI